MKGAGGAYVLITGVVLLLVTMMIYNVFSPVLAGMQGPVNDTLSGMDATVATNALATIDTTSTVWKFWPILLIFGIIIWVVGSAARRESVTEEF